MNNLKITRHFFKKTGWASLIILSQFNAVHALDVSINGSQSLPLNTDISYNFQSTPSTVGFQVSAPILCTSIRNSSESLVLLLNDANNVTTTSLDSGIRTTVYDFAEDRVRFTTDDSIKCATQNGLHREVVSRLGFEDRQDDLQVTMLDVNGQPFDGSAQVSDEQNFIYQYVLDNNGATAVTANFGEYYRLDPTRPSFAGVAGSDWSCAEVNVGSGSTTTCGDNSLGEATVELNNAIIEPGEQLVITASRIVDIPAGTVGNVIEVLAAVFGKNADDTVIGNNIAFQSFGTTDNNAPVISSLSNQTVLEDGASDVLSFTVSDVESNAASLVVSASSSNPSIISVANIVLAGSGGNRTVDFSPNADANGSVIITLTVSDGISTSDEQFSVDVTSVNDAPTFSLQTIADWPAGSVGGQNLKDFVQNLNFGASLDESTQSVIESNISVQSDPNGIFAVNFAPFLSNGGFLTYGLSGRGGTAVIDVTLRDNGGTDNGGVDTSDAVSFSITVLNTLPVISAVNDISFNEDTGSSLIDFTISDAETLADDLVMSAISSDPSIVPVSGIQFTGTGGSRSVQITPVTNQNTSVSGPVTITLVVDDGSDVTQTTFQVTIDPINDAPSFDLSADIVWPAASSGLKQNAGFANNIQMGPTTDENLAQLVSVFNVTVSGDAIFGSLGEPVFDNNGGLAYVLNGTAGVATIQVSLQDNGGVANGGVDTSLIQSFTITVQQ